QASPLVGQQWTCGPQTRGQAPIGYLKGMALSYARVYHMYTDPDRLQAEMRDPLNPNPPPEQPLQRDRFVVSMARGAAPGASTITDAVAKFQGRFARFGGPLPVFGGAPPVDLSTDGVDVLRALFTMLFGLGMCESSGQHCEGADTSPSRRNALTATSAEAGLFQVSFDIGMDRGDFKDLFDMYERGWPAPAPGPCMLDVFSDGVACSAAQLHNFGAGVPGENQDAVEFQRF